MARVALIYPKPNRITFDTTHTINLGLAYMAACLERRGHDVEVHDSNMEDDGYLPGKLRGVEVACFYVITAAFKAALAKAEVIKTQLNPDCKIMFGGPHPTARPEECLASPYVDYAAVGEGEVLICDFVDNLRDPPQRDTLPGLVYRGPDGAIINNGKAQYPPDLDALPFPAYHLFRHQALQPTRPTWVDARTLRCGTMMTSRGCPHRCVFCTSAAGRPFNKKFRAMSAERVVEEMEWLIRDYGVNFIELQDDVFNLIPQRAEDICRLLLKKKIRVRWSIPNGLSRVENITEEFLRLCKRAGCVDAWFAAESGSDRIRNEIIHKRNTIDQVRRAIQASHRVGLQTGAFFILGSPDETPEEMQQTIDLACALPLDRAQFTIATPFPGSELWDWIDREGRWLVRDYDLFGPYENVVYFELGRLRAEQVLRMYKRAFRTFYLRPSHLIHKVAFRRETYTNLPLLVRQAARFMT
jgi:radical SAM superfamily enzyme YgiQ (UPF0313 family)